MAGRRNTERPRTRWQDTIVKDFEELLGIKSHEIGKIGGRNYGRSGKSCFTNNDISMSFKMAETIIIIILTCISDTCLISVLPFFCQAVIVLSTSI